MSVSPGSSHAGIPGLVAGRRGAPFGRSSASGRHAQHPDGGGDAGAGLPRHQVRSPPPRRLGSFLPARPPGRGLPESLGIRPCVSCPLGEGGRRRACLTAVSCWNQGIIIIRFPSFSCRRRRRCRRRRHQGSQTNKQSQEAQGRGARGRPAAGRAGPAGEPRGTRGHARAHGRTRTGTVAGAVQILMDHFLSL